MLPLGRAVLRPGARNRAVGDTGRPVGPIRALRARYGFLWRWFILGYSSAGPYAWEFVRVR